MFSPSWLNNVNKSSILPPLHVSKKVKESDEWQKAMMDSFEHIGTQQLQENLSFNDLYRMIDGKMAYQELREVIPHLDSMADLMDGAGIPTFLKHYDIIGIIINALVNKYAEMQDKFHVTDTGEIAQNEFLRFKTEEIQKTIKQVIDNEVKIHLAQNGLTEEGQQFESDEQQQQYLQQLQQAKQEYTPKDALEQAQKSFKTLGVQWGEATLERDKEIFGLDKMSRREIRDYFISGRWFREYKIGYDKYYAKDWSPKNTFISKEIDNTNPAKSQFIGRVHLYTPSEIIQEYGHKISADKQREILGGNENWKDFVGSGVLSGSVEEAITSNFNKPVRVPFEGYHGYEFALGIQDDFGIPMGDYTSINADGSQSTHDRYLPRFASSGLVGGNRYFAKMLRDDFEHRTDLCQVTEVYFKAYDLFGYLTYENEFGRVVREEVTEDILADFIREKGIKKTLKVSLEKAVETFEVNTLQWVYTPNTYEGVKIQSPYLDEPIYLYCKKMDFQIKGDSEFERLLPVGGHIGKSTAIKIVPFQANYNLAMNQIYKLLEKEIGMFFLMDVGLIPSEYEAYGDAEEALVNLRNVVKETGIFPVATSGDHQKNANQFNQFQVYDLSYTKQIQNRIQIAEFNQSKAYEQIGISPILQSAPTTYQTATGVKTSNEASWLQTAELYNDFSDSQKDTLILHLAVAQYAQSNKRDLSLSYTKSDGSLKFLQLSDPDFPLRRIGLIASADNKKRKELESLQQVLVNNNTLGSDVLELAKIIGSDSYSELIELATQERMAREAQKQKEYEQQQGLLQQQNKNAQDLQLHAEEKEDFRQLRDLTTKIEVAKLNAAGRAADKQSDTEGFNFIEKSASLALKSASLDQKTQRDAENFKLQEKTADNNHNLGLEKLKLDAEKLKERILDRRSKETIAFVNKN